MAKVFTQEEQGKIKGQVLELVYCQSGRETLRQLEAKTGCNKISDERSRQRAGCQWRYIQFWLRVIPV